jgi:hypothetical protein
MNLFEMLAQKPIDLPAVAAYLDGLTPEGRVAEMRTIPGRLQAKLWHESTGFRPLTVDHFVPPAVPTRKFVRHYGRNSLPVFQDFEKRFARPVADAGELWGYNHGPTMGLIGPGHFVLRNGPGDGEMQVDYYRVPPEAVDGAPNIVPNTRGLSILVYAWMVDVMHGVSEHLTVGRAVQRGHASNNYFLLCRQEIKA